MKLALISGSWPPAVCGVADGISIYTRFLLEDEAHSAVIITSKGYNSSYEKEPRLRVLDIVLKWKLNAFGKILKALISEKPDIVHIEYPTKEYGRNIFINLLPVLLRLRGYKVVITLHEYSFNLTWKGRVRLCLSIFGAHAVLVSDPAYIRDIRKVFKRKRLDVIPIAPNIPASNLDIKEREELRGSVAPLQGTIILGYFGFINANKIIIPVLMAVKELRDTYGKNIIFLLIGDIFERDPSNPLVRELKFEIIRLGIEKNCFITGYISDKKTADYLSILDYAVLLYKSGISPRNATFMAAAAQGIKIITTLNPSYKPDYENIFLIGSEESMAGKIISIVMEHSDGGRTEIRPDNQYYRTRWGAFVKKHLEVYYSLLDR